MTIAVHVLQGMKFRYMFTSENNIVLTIITNEQLFTCHCTNILVLCNPVFTILQIKSKCNYSNTFAALRTCWGSFGLCALSGVCITCVLLFAPPFSFT